MHGVPPQNDSGLQCFHLGISLVLQPAFVQPVGSRAVLQQSTAGVYSIISEEPMYQLCAIIVLQ